MATLIRMTSHIRTLDSTLFPSHSGNVVVRVEKADDGSVEIWHIHAASPTEANFNSAPVGSFLYDTASIGTVKRHLTATTWGTLTYV